MLCCFFWKAEAAIRYLTVTGVRTAPLPFRAGGARAPPPPAPTRRQLVLGVLRILHEPLGASGALLQRGGLERDGLELRELGPHGVVPCRVVAGGPRGPPAPEGPSPPAPAPPLPARARPPLHPP